MGAVIDTMANSPEDVVDIELKEVLWEARNVPLLTK